MKIFNKLIMMIIAAGTLVFTVKPDLNIYAEDEKDTGMVSPVEIEDGAAGTLEIRYANEEEPISGIQCYVYLIAEFHTDGKAYFTDAFWDSYNGDTALDFTVEMASDKKVLAEMVEGYVNRYQLEPEAMVQTDAEGIALFTDLKLGYYLVCADVYETDTYIARTEPSLIAIPGESTDGTYSAYINAKFSLSEKEEETQDFEVLKKWNDNGQNRPAEVKMQLLKDGVPEGGTVILNEENNWSYTWHNLSVNHVWSAIEVEVPTGYTVQVSASSNTKTQTTITNAGSPNVPNTGDTNHIKLYGGISAGALLVILAAVYVRRKTADRE